MYPAAVSALSDSVGLRVVDSTEINSHISLFLSAHHNINTASQRLLFIDLWEVL